MWRRIERKDRLQKKSTRSAIAAESSIKGAKRGTKIVVRPVRSRRTGRESGLHLGSIGETVTLLDEDILEAAIIRQANEPYVRLIETAVHPALVKKLKEMAGEYQNRPGTNNLRRSLTFYIVAANDGDAESQFNVGTFFENGLGTEKDAETAVKWYAKAADQGYAPAQYALGLCYSEGNGVRRDPKRAIRLFQKAASQGDVDAKYALGLAFRRGQGADRKLRAAFLLLKDAAKAGHAAAQFSLGLAFARGEGTRIDFAQAKIWYGKAAEQGDDDAKANLDLLNRVLAQR